MKSRSNQTKQASIGLTVLVILGVVLYHFLAGPPRTSTSSSSPSDSPNSAQHRNPQASTDRTVTGSSRNAPGWTSNASLESHFEKHGDQFPGFSRDQYLRLAQELRDAPVGGDILESVRPDGVISRFDRKSGTFLAFNRDGTIRTMFRPSDGEQYFHRQKSHAR